MKALIFLPIIAIFPLLSEAKGKTVNVSVTNELAIDRGEEVIEIDAQRVTSRVGEKFVITDSKGQRVDYQLSHDGKVLIPVTVGAKSTAKYRISQGEPGAVDTLAFGQHRPDLQDDFAWENAYSGYRLYGKSFRDGGGKVYGYDLWCKSADKPILAKLYRDNNNGITYHKNHGEGFDGYTVGPTLGACMNALILNDSICYPCAYQSFELIENGPIRMTVKLTCYPEKIGNDNVVETRVITLDRYSHFNKTTVSYNGLSQSLDMAIGIVVHADNPHGYTIDEPAHAITCEDLTDNLQDNNGSIYIGAVTGGCSDIKYVPFETVTANAVGQVVIYDRYTVGEPYTYYWGSTWSKRNEVDYHEWNQIVENQALIMKNPLKVSIK